MYAIIESGGKQHRVVEGEVLRLEKLAAATGDTVDFDRVLLIKDGETLNVGTPYLADSHVTAEVLEQGRGDKLKIVRFRRRKHHEKQLGHRQAFTAVKITAIATAAPPKKTAKAAPKKPATKKSAPAPKKPTEESANQGPSPKPE
ncbi:MAG: 50S ribosomal protein L21 [Cellvibrionales bacterium]|nr:50S ribosomal protein L21 [Cellvibrionales bacterium]